MWKACETGAPTWSACRTRPPEGAVGLGTRVGRHLAHLGLEG